MHALFVLPLFQISSAADRCGDVPLTTFHIESQGRQEEMMRNALSTIRLQPRGFDRYFGDPIETGRPLCIWRGVLCTYGVVTTFVIARIQGKEFAVNMAWLPPTLAHVHFDGATLGGRGLQAERLPRALRYLFVKDCRSEDPSAVPANFNFCMVPRKMEELYIIRGWFAGTVDLCDLPAPMRVLQIVHQSVQTVFIDWAKLPEPIKLISLSKLGIFGPEIVSVGGGERPAHLVRFGDCANPMYSKYYDDLNRRKEIIGEKQGLKLDYYDAI